jgi:uncharacterized RDD family membrane protein YckC
VPPGGWQQSPIGQTSRTSAPRAPLASWGSRLAAYLIDGVIIGVPAAILFFALLGGVSGADDVGKWVAALFGFLAWLLAVAIVLMVYAPVLMARGGTHNGQTWGKQLMGIRATRNSGQEWTFGSAALREVALKNVAVLLASFMIPVIPWFLNFFWPLWDDENRALHDMAAESHVVKA